METLANNDESKWKHEEERVQKGQDKCSEAKTQARRQLVLSAEHIKSNSNQIDVNSDDKPRLRFPRSDLGSYVVQKYDVTRQKSDDQLPVNPLTQKNKNSDSLISNRAVPVLKAMSKWHAGGEPGWQQSEDHKVIVRQPSQLSSGE